MPSWQVQPERKRGERATDSDTAFLVTSDATTIAIAIDDEDILTDEHPNYDAVGDPT